MQRQCLHAGLRGNAAGILGERVGPVEMVFQPLVAIADPRHQCVNGFAEHRFISARHGSGVGNLYTVIDSAYANAQRKLPTPELTRVLEQAVQEHQPPKVHGRRIKLRYAHQGGRNPPIVVIHGNQAEAVPATYRRYLINRFREAFSLHGTPIRMEFKSGDNPFHGRKNLLTERQLRKRQRLKSFVNRKS